ncbi:permease-like cell division protein FtsX [Candidatus Saccharibacteria bacterium]|nr:permease-like cell division protein FtsX [Candidatus Saccharibacteria bacterium]
MSKKSTVSRLKQMAKSGSGHFFRQGSRVFKYGAIGFGRNIWLSITATIVTTLTLILLFATIVASSVLTSTANAMREKIDISIFFESDTTKEELASMSKTIEKDENVKSVEYSTAEEEYDKLYQSYKESDNQSMLTTLEIVGRDLMIQRQPAAMRIKVYNTDDLSSIKNIVNSDEEFIKHLSKKEDPTYNTNSSAIQTISSWADIATKGGTALSILFLVISTLVIFNTIRMAIYSRSEEIYMEKLVGAGNVFIRGPFLVEAMISGVFAGIISTILSLVGYYALSPRLEAYEIQVGSINSFLSEPKNVILIALALILTGSVITLISARLAIQKYLKRL